MTRVIVAVLARGRGCIGAIGSGISCFIEKIRHNVERKKKAIIPDGRVCNNMDDVSRGS